MHLRCIVIAGPLAGRVAEFELVTGVVVGRSRDCGLILQDPELAPAHFRLEPSARTCTLRDLGHGTFVNGRKMDSAELRPGDEVRAGRTTIRIEKVSGTTKDATQVARCDRCQAGGAANPKATACLCEACEEATGKAPEIFPGYKVLRKLAEGGMGAVYLALNLGTRERVALKTLRPKLANDPTATAMFLREVQSTAQLDHPHAVRFLASGFAKGLFFFVMEYVDGPNLDVLVRENGPLPLATAAPLVSQVLSVLELAHGRGLVHRDVKPANILLARRPPDLHAKLADFGLMRSFARVGYSFITKTGDALGTPAYMPPEQVQDAKHVGPPADVYSLAATFFFALTGEAPIAVPSGKHPVVAVLEEKPRSLGALLPSAPPALDLALGACLARDPARRPQTATELRRVLSSALGGT